MAAKVPCYHFDNWAEYLTLTLAENIARCHLGHNSVEKVKIGVKRSGNWPVNFKVILDNNLVAPCNAHKQVNGDASYAIDYIYTPTSKIPRHAKGKDPAGEFMAKKAKLLDKTFYADVWLFEDPNGIASLLRNLALRSTARLLSKQLNHQGVDLSDQFTVQYRDEDNYLSFSYEGIKQDLSQLLNLYGNNKEIKKLAAQMYFKRPENRAWFMGL